MIFIGSPDYYDFYNTIYGRDNHIVYNRGERPAPIINDYTSVQPFSLYLHVCGYMYECLVVNRKVYHVADFQKRRNKIINPSWLNSGELEIQSQFRVEGKYIKLSIKMEPVLTQVNVSENCPIVLADQIPRYGKAKFIHNPILDDYKFSKVIEPEKMYRTMYDFLLASMDERDHDIHQSNDKILSKGFDLKQSFRHRKNEKKP